MYKFASMFFVGISAHIIVYLLVPIFLIVCLYFGGQPMTPEESNILPVCITYENQQQTNFSASEICYYNEEQQTVSPKKQEFSRISPSDFSFPPIFVPQNITLEVKTGRAPPIGKPENQILQRFQ